MNERPPPPQALPPIRTLVLTGQCNQWHDSDRSSRLLAQFLRASGRFETTIVRSPGAGAEMAGFSPRWDDYELVVLDYDGDRWPAATETAFAQWVERGGGLVIYHHADNAFAEWPAYNRMIGVGGWGGRDESAGPLVRWSESGMILDDESPGVACHPSKHEFLVAVRAPEHPIMRGLPGTFLHAADELYSRLRGPAEALEILASARSDPALENSTGEHEPVLMTIRYGKGRVFHTALGHVGPADPDPVPSVHCIGFLTTLLRGAEWAATGEVTLPVPADFPDAGEARTR